MTVLVTGGARYIGSPMVHALVDAGERVAVLDNLATGFDWAIAKGASLVIGDVGDRPCVAALTLLRREPPVRRLVRDSGRTSRARLDGFCRLHRSDDPIEHVDRHRRGARHGAPAARRRGYMAAHSSLVPGLDRGAAATAVTRRVRAALWQSGSGRCAAFYPAGSMDLSALARPASLRGAISGGRTAACGKNAAGFRRAHVQPILDGSARARSPDATGALTSNSVVQILLETLRRRDQRSQSSQEDP